MRQIQQSPNLSNPPSNQQPYQVQGVFGHHPGLQSPYLNNPAHFPTQAPNESAYYTSNPSPRSTTSTTYYPSGKFDKFGGEGTRGAS